MNPERVIRVESGPQRVAGLIRENSPFVCRRCGGAMHLYTREVEVRGEMVTDASEERIPALARENEVLRCAKCSWSVDVNEGRARARRKELE